MACYLNSRKARERATHRISEGDKETYWVAFALVSSPYHFVPGYAGGIGRITHPDNDENIEQICTLQILHVLESTGEPLWFSNSITESKEANNVQYIVPEGWVGHNGRWQDGGRRFPNEFCVNMPEGEWDRDMGSPEPVLRVGDTLRSQINRIIEEVSKYDEWMEREGLIELSRSVIPP